jgi:hypothetical protein
MTSHPLFAPGVYLPLLCCSAIENETVMIELALSGFDSGVEHLIYM